ncbi:MAG: helix-turn-helix transcriptional regulator [Phenylobacterium sp.]|uniref:helix-turn-helix domain-containing protein n=1 Tax=Phenylobacterium sp. TaxID=1871053 RepID=UPI001A259854|nr:helix-turn-helix transcriptional regulator [Phenylobacterium sp.]MBJ7410833.1 helix-turn-helix transcriptional regulator [Phenylobacterium sp.]
MDEKEAARILTPAACRAARALLGWTIDDLVKAARTSPNSVSRFERGDGPIRPTTAVQIVQAFAASGVEILNGDGTGVRMLRPDPR